MSCLGNSKGLSPGLFMKMTAAFSRLCRAADISEQYYAQPLLVCYSGGKDSDVLVELARRSGIRFEVVHSHTTADSPVTVRYTRQRLAEFASYGIPVSVHYPTQDGKRVSMWSLISQQTMPPTRKARYCCEVLKEAVGKDRCVATGVRWSESVRRQLSRGIFEAFAKSPDDRVIVTTDVADMGGVLLHAQQRKRVTVNPIIDWTDEDVWEYLHYINVPSNPEYQNGFTRVGCIGCPMAHRSRRWEFEKYPAYRTLYVDAFQRMLDRHPEICTTWKTGEDVYEWWLSQ